MSDPPPIEAQSPAPRFSWQFSLRTLFVLVTLLVIALAWFVNGPERQRRAAEQLRAAGEIVSFRMEPSSDSVVLGTEARLLPREYCESVKFVMLSRSTDKARHLPALAAFPAIEGLYINDDPLLDDARLAPIADLTNLQQLTVLQCGITEAGLAHLAGLTELTELDLHVDRLTDVGLSHLARVTKLERLRFVGDTSQITAAGYAALADRTNLRSLTLSFRDSQMTDEGLAHLCTLPRLEYFNLSGGQITGRPLRDFASRQTLGSLTLRDCPLDDRSLASLAGFNRLQHLDLEGSSIGDAGMVHLSGLRNLGSLQLARTHITDAGLVHLRPPHLPRLGYLDARNTAVTQREAAEVEKLRDPSFYFSRGGELLNFQRPSRNEYPSRKRNSP